MGAMEQYEIDGMIVDQIIYWWDQPVVYLGRPIDGDDRPHLVVLVEDSRSRQVYHRMVFADERGLRATLAGGAAPTSATYDLAIGYARLESSTGDETWTVTTRDRLVALDGAPTSLPPSRSRGHVDMARWGVDHWTLLRHLTRRFGDVQPGEAATVDYRTIRINPDNHRIQALSSDSTKIGGAWSGEDGTRLAGHADGTPDLRIGYHDDVDCLEEMEDEGLLELVSTFRGQFSLTPCGVMLGRRLDDHLQGGGSLQDFHADPRLDSSGVPS